MSTGVEIVILILLIAIFTIMITGYIDMWRAFKTIEMIERELKRK